MGRKPLQIKPGEHYGWLTVLGPAPKDHTGHIRYHVRCRCGKEYDVLTGFLHTGNPKCWECGHAFEKRVPDRTNQIINGWKICSEAGRNEKGIWLYDCECQRCGNHSLKTYGALTVSKSDRCQKCEPDYHFVIENGIAKGILPSGDEFCVDADMVPYVSKYCWNLGSDGYIVRANRKLSSIPLHWFVLGFESSPPHIIDHIDRKATNCCRNNLRFVTLQQNSMNRSIGANNTTGYVGVTYDRRSRKFKAKICFNSKTINLLLSNDIIICAQAYNLAADFLFHEFAGHHNDVPDASPELRKSIMQKLQPYLPQAMRATESVEKADVA